jgi:hypothetical protein
MINMNMRRLVWFAAVEEKPKSIDAEDGWQCDRSLTSYFPDTMPSRDAAIASSSRQILSVASMIPSTVGWAITHVFRHPKLKDGG